MSQTLARRARIKDLSNKAEGIFQYVGNNNVLFRLIGTGNELTSDVNLAVALFTDFARSHKLGSTQTRDTINAIYRRVGKLMCLIDIIHAAAGEEVMPEPYESIDFCYMNEYRTMLREAVIRGMPDDYKGPRQNPLPRQSCQTGLCLRPGLHTGRVRRPLLCRIHPQRRTPRPETGFPLHQIRA